MQPNMSHEERQARKENNENRVLEFLASEGVSTAAMLSELLGYQQPQSVYKILRRLQENRIISARKIDVIGNLYRLTKSGMDALPPDLKPKIVNAGDINPLSINHRLAIQKCHIMMIKNNVKWEFSTGRAKKGSQKPDGVIWFHLNSTELSPVAVEVELTVKTRKRYNEIIRVYSGMKYQVVVYVVPNQVMCDRIKRIFEDIKIRTPFLFKSVQFVVYTMDFFARKFTEEYSQKRLGDIKKALAEHEARRQQAEREKEKRRQEQQPAPVQEEPETAQEPSRKKWGLF